MLVSASAVGIYGVRGEERLDESAGPQPVFQSEICRLWEETAERASALGVRCVLPRFGVVLGNEGGALPAFTRPASFGLAAVMGTGAQGFPWIHIEDAVGLILWALEQDIRGPLNAVAPGLVSQRGFQQSLCRVLHRPLWLRVPAWPVRLALGEMAQLLVDGSSSWSLRRRCVQAIDSRIRNWAPRWRIFSSAAPRRGSELLLHLDRELARRREQSVLAPPELLSRSKFDT